MDALNMNVAPPDLPPMAAIAARYDHRIGQVMIKLRCGLFLAFRPRDIQGLEAAKKADLKDIEVSPAGSAYTFPVLMPTSTFHRCFKGILDRSSG
jgi:hypothetical protein